MKYFIGLLALISLPSYADCLPQTSLRTPFSVERFGDPPFGTSDLGLEANSYHHLYFDGQVSFADRRTALAIKVTLTSDDPASEKISQTGSEAGQMTYFRVFAQPGNVPDLNTPIKVLGKLQLPQNPENISVSFFRIGGPSGAITINELQIFVEEEPFDCDNNPSWPDTRKTPYSEIPEYRVNEEGELAGLSQNLVQFGFFGTYGPSGAQLINEERFNTAYRSKDIDITVGTLGGLYDLSREMDAKTIATIYPSGSATRTEEAYRQSFISGCQAAMQGTERIGLSNILGYFFDFDLSTQYFQDINELRGAISDLRSNAGTSTPCLNGANERPFLVYGVYPGTNAALNDLSDISSVYSNDYPDNDFGFFGYQKLPQSIVPANFCHIVSDLPTWSEEEPFLTSGQFRSRVLNCVYHGFTYPTIWRDVYRIDREGNETPGIERNPWWDSVEISRIKLRASRMNLFNKKRNHINRRFIIKKTPTPLKSRLTQLGNGRAATFFNHSNSPQTARYCLSRELLENDSTLRRVDDSRAIEMIRSQNFFSKIRFFFETGSLCLSDLLFEIEVPAHEFRVYRTN